MDNYILEACVDSYESAKEAAAGGANRLELCSNLIIGGTTPSPCLFEEIKKDLNIKIHILIRPRFGDFCYTDREFLIMKEEVKMFQELGADGVVIGMLCPDGTLDMERMKALKEKAGDMSITLHRAFDLCAEPLAELEQAIQLGIDAILTSGQQNTCIEGAGLLKELIEKSRGRIDILIGGGVSREVIEQIYPITKGTSYHMSGKIVVDSAMKYRKDGVNMGLPGLSEYSIYRTDAGQMNEAAEYLKRL